MKHAIFIAGWLALLLVHACENEAFTLTVGEEFTDATTKMLRIDTLDVVMSTHRADSVITSGRGGALVGICNDDNIGEITASSYFNLAPSLLFSIGEDEVYDSISLVLTYNDYYYGDTSGLHQLNVHCLSEVLDPDDETSRYNTSTTAFHTVPCGSIQFEPRPTKGDSIEIPLDIELGREMFDYLNGELSEDVSVSDFQELFPGLTIQPGGAGPGAILGFGAKDSTLYLKIHTHEPGLQTNEIEHIIPLARSYLQYNKISSDWSANPSLSELGDGALLPSSETNEQTFIQSGLGLYTKISFPGLQAMTEIDNSVLTTARLYLEPVDMSSWESSNAGALRLYSCDYFGNMEGVLVNESGNDLTPTYIRDAMYNLNNQFIFDITDYIGVEMQDFYVHPAFAFFIGMSATSVSTTLDRITLATDQSAYKNLKLELTFFQYDQ